MALILVFPGLANTFELQEQVQCRLTRPESVNVNLIVGFFAQIGVLCDKPFKQKLKYLHFARTNFCLINVALFCLFLMYKQCLRIL